MLLDATSKSSLQLIVVVTSITEFSPKGDSSVFQDSYGFESLQNLYLSVQLAYGASEVKIVSEEDGELDEGDDDFSEGWEEDFDDSE
jgi:hypothetical protein